MKANKLKKINKELEKFIGHRKHCSMMEEWEKRGLLKRLGKVDHWILSSHALLRMNQKNIKVTQRDILSAVTNSDIIEYKIDKKNKLIKERVLLRSKAVVNGNNNISIVYDLTDKSIVSVWINSVTDRHKTLDFSIYNEKMRVFL